MINSVEYAHLLGKRIRVVCEDGSECVGIWCDWTSADDNEPDPESITLDERDWAAMIEIYVPDIVLIEPYPKK